MPPSRRCGFSLIELLVVIAIIALLAAMIFPVFSRVKESSRQGQCLSNLHKLYVAANLYRDDNGGEYPPQLLGYAEQPDGTLVTAAGDPHVDASHLVHGFLLNRKQFRDNTAFLCPDNVGITANVNTITIAHFPPKPANWTGQWIGDVLQGVCGSDSYGTIACWAQSPNHPPMFFYTSDAYDVGPRVDPQTGKAVIGANGQPVFDLRYSRDWTGGTGTQDLPIQLKYPNPPPDRTILAWCTWHAATAGTGNVMAITMAGNVKKIDLNLMAQYGPAVFNR